MTPKSELPQMGHTLGKKLVKKSVPTTTSTGTHNKRVASRDMNAAKMPTAHSTPWCCIRGATSRLHRWQYFIIAFNRITDI
jgi:hypothetical protein